MKFIIPFLLMIAIESNAQLHQATDFSAITIDGKTFRLSDLKGKKIFLSFFRNGACALCNLRVHEIAQRQEEFDRAGIQVIAVFESSAEDMKPYVGQQDVKFTLLSDPDAKIYNIYGVMTSPEIINNVTASGSARARVAEAADNGFPLTKQERTNFFRIPAEVLIDENFNIVRFHHCDQLVNHLSLDEAISFR
jgi:thioredoxin-dependent peroxiredoxin